MGPQTFSNAMVATVGAYAEVVAEMAKRIEYLEATLRTVASSPPTDAARDELLDAVRDLVARFHAGGSEMAVSAELSNLITALAPRLAAYDRAKAAAPRRGA